MTQGKKLSKLQYMVITAVLAAIIVFLMFSGLGYIPTGFGFTITILMIPVAIGAILLGPGAGAILGTVFGLTSLATCFLGLDALGVALLAISPWKTVIVCLVPRILVGYLCGLIFKALNGKILKGRKTDLLSYGIASVSAALLNTLFFFVALWIFFGSDPAVTQYTGGSSNFFVLIGALGGINAIGEAVACLILGTAIAKALNMVMKRASKI